MHRRRCRAPVFTTIELCSIECTGGASPRARLIMDKAARLVRPEIFFAPSDDGCVPMTIHTGDNMDLEPNNHYILTAVMTVGSTLSAAQSAAFKAGFAAMPPVDSAADLRGVQMTASDDPHSQHHSSPLTLHRHPYPRTHYSLAHTATKHIGTVETTYAPPPAGPRDAVVVRTRLCF